MAEAADAVDLLIAGAGLAGCTAAIAAARAGLRVAVLARAAQPQRRACPGWLAGPTLERCRALGVQPDAFGVAFSGLGVRSWEQAAHTRVDDPALAGVLLRDPLDLLLAFREAAKSAGAVIRTNVAARSLQLGDREVVLLAEDGTRHSGKLLLVGDGAGSLTAQAAQLATPRLDASPAHLLARWATETSAPGMDLCLGGGAGLKLALVVRGPRETRVDFVTYDRSTPPRSQLAAFLTAASGATLVTGARDARVEERPGLAGAALELDTHVGKRCLLIGTAGGFAASFSGDACLPALISGECAAEVAAAALQAPLVQDVLPRFDDLWRQRLAEYLRPPSTDLTLLMPMLFQNAHMARRIARAYLLGDRF